MMSIMKRCSFVVLAVVGVFIAALVNAHHGSVNNPALYLAENADEPVEVEGVITEIFWRAPHIRYRMEDPEGETWELEFSPSPVSFIRAGITSDEFLQVGDFVRAAGFASRRNERTLGLSNLLLPNGLEHVGGMAGASVRWANEPMTFENLEPPPEKIAEARRTANGIFRTWSIRQAPQPRTSEYQPHLTERGREIAATMPQDESQALELQCRTGMPTAMFERSRVMIEDQGDRIHIWVEQYNTHRTIYTNPETAPEPTYSNVGHSLGHWEGDDLIVNTSHVNHPTFDEGKTPQSDQATYVERFSTRDDGEWLDYTFTITDPVMFAEPVTLEMPRQWIPGVELHTWDCAPEWDDA